MASANSNDKLIIFKGDDTGGVFGRRLAFTIEAGDGVDLSGCRAEWIFDGIVKTFAAPLIPGEVREVFYSHNETRCMALGVRYGTFRIIDASGKVRTLTNTKPVEVTNDAARCYPGASDASFVVHGIGDIKHSEFADLEEKEAMTLKEVGSMVNTLIRKLKGTVSAFAAILAFGAFADVAITPQTDFGDISPTAKLKAVVEASGAISGIDTNAVDALANSAVVTNALIVATTNRVAAHVANTSNPHAVTAAQIGALPLVEDKNGNKTAVTIGNRTSGAPVGEGSIANGDMVIASGPGSHAEGINTVASGKYSHTYGVNTFAQADYSYAGGLHAETKTGDDYAFVWNGDGEIDDTYSSNGQGTFNINPAGGLNGFYIGKHTLPAIILGSVTNTVEKIANRAAEESKKSKLWKADTNGYLTAEGEYFRRDVEDYFTASVPGDPETYDLVWEDARNGFYSSPFFSDNPSTYGFLTYSKDHARWELDVGGISTFTHSGTWDDSTIEISAFTLVRHKVSKETYSKVDRFVWKNELDSKADLSMISATNTTFSNAVLAVNVDFATNTTGAAYVAVTNALAGFGFDAEALAELPGGKVYGSIGTLLAALAAAIAWLKKNKVQTLKLNDNSVETSADGGVAKLDDFFTESNSLLTGTIEARLPYPLYAVPSTGILKDRAINTTSLASVTVPDNFTDLLIRASVASSLAVTMPEAIATKYGDTFPGEAGEYLITITKTGVAEAYVRTIKLEVANA